jgi:CubicO group peptidase (beta-lactamase class C family)
LLTSAEMRRPRLLTFLAAVSLAACTHSSTPRAPATKETKASSTAPATTPTGTPSPPAPVPLLEDGAAGPYAVATPESEGLRREPLERLVEAAERTGTDALLVIHRDRAVVARSFGGQPRRLELMSVTKGFVGIAVGFLLEEGKIPSLDAPLATWFPEWKQGKKARVTLRHVLSHTSGLAHKPAAGELTKQKDRVAYARALPIETEPGEVFSYNNEATQLLSFVIAAAAREPLDKYLDKKLFEPLGIRDVGWERDAAGNVAAFYGLSLSAHDLAKVGIVLRDGGLAEGKRVIPASWIDRMQQPVKNASWHGLLTWLLYDGPWQVQTPERRSALAAEGFLAQAKLLPLDGRRFPSRAAYWMEAGDLLAPSEREALGRLVRDDLSPIASVDGKLVGFNFNGWLGQYLVVYPRAGVVAVRQRREPPNVTDEDNKKVGLRTFPDLVRAALPDEIAPRP